MAMLFKKELLIHVIGMKNEDKYLCTEIVLLHNNDDTQWADFGMKG